MVSTLAILAIACQSGRVAKGPNLDDRDVIQTVLLSYLSHPGGWTSTSSKPKFVVLRPNYRSWPQSVSKGKAGYADSLNSMVEGTVEEIARLKGVKNQVERTKSTEQLALLRQLAPTVRTPRTYAPAQIVTLKSMTWDSRVILTDTGSTFDIAPRDKSFDERLDHVAIFGEFSPPSYAPDGNTCIVGLSFLWSMHGGEASYILKRSPNGWTIVTHSEVFFL